MTEWRKDNYYKRKIEERRRKEQEIEKKKEKDGRILTIALINYNKNYYIFFKSYKTEV